MNACKKICEHGGFSLSQSHIYDAHKSMVIMTHVAPRKVKLIVFPSLIEGSHGVRYILCRCHVASGSL